MSSSLRGGIMSIISRAVKFSLFFALATLAVPFTQQTGPTYGREQAVPSQIRKIYDEDQSNRNDEAGDARRRSQVQDLIHQGKVQSGEDYYYAAFIFQHGQKPGDYLYAHVLAVTALGKGFSGAKWLCAATLDRYLQSVKQSQVFGTQFGSLFTDRDDQEPYDHDFLSDGLRAEWCVTNYSQQLKILSDTRAGKPFVSTRTCPLP